MWEISHVHIADTIIYDIQKFTCIYCALVAFSCPSPGASGAGLEHEQQGLHDRGSDGPGVLWADFTQQTLQRGTDEGLQVCQLLLVRPTHLPLLQWALVCVCECACVLVSVSKCVCVCVCVCVHVFLSYVTTEEGSQSISY